MDMNKYIDVFIEEAREHLDNLNACLLELEKNPDDMSQLDEIFRASHTLKGMAGTMGFEKVASLTHEMENILQDIRGGNKRLTTEIIDVLFKTFDVLDEIVNNIAEAGSEGDVDPSGVLEEFRKSVEGNTPPKSLKTANEDKGFLELNTYEQNIFSEAVERGLKVYKVEITLNEDCMLKSARAFVVFNSLEKLGEIIKTEPSVEDIEDEKFENKFTLYLVTERNQHSVNKALDSIAELKEIKIQNVSGAALSDVEQNAPLTEKGLDKKETEAKQNTSNSGDSFAAKLKTGKTVRVDIERLDNLMNLVSELIIIKTRLEEVESKKREEEKEIFEAIEYMERITSSLHDAVMKVRMVPIAQVFNRFPRMVRDLSKELNKEIDLIIQGEETELDRTVIDEIGDPLIHLIRNAVDHGIEPTHERVQLGKPQKGTINLMAYHDGNNVVIEIRDDGRGIDREKVLKKAAEKGLIKKAENYELDEALQFLFMPGFSTASKVTDLSGRGVGLDVVKTKIESLGGNIEVKTKEMQGTQFIIRLPLTLAIIQALLVRVDKEKYAIPLSSIRETVTIDSSTLKNINNNMATLFRNEVLPIVNLKEKLDIQTDEHCQKELTVVIVKKGDKSLGLVVDELIGQQEIVIKTLGNLLKNIDIIAGATILGNGNVALILDTNSFFKGV